MKNNHHYLLGAIALISTCAIGVPKPAFGAADEGGAAAPETPEPPKAPEPVKPVQPAAKPVVPPVPAKPVPPAAKPPVTNPVRPGQGVQPTITHPPLPTGKPPEQPKIKPQEVAPKPQLNPLLAKAESIRDGSELPRSEIVELRMQLAQLRRQDDATALLVDEEIARLEKVLEGLSRK